MNPSSSNCRKLRRFIAERLGIISTIMPTAFLVVMSLAALAMLSDLACSSPTPTTPTPTLTPPPSHKSSRTPAPPPTPIPTLIPPVTLREPQDGVCYDCGSEVTLRWSCPYILKAKDYYRLDVWGTERSSFPYQRTYHKGNRSTRVNLSPGIYNWAVAVVRSIDRGKHMLLSEESDGFSFEIAPPAPVVHSISPTFTVQGTGVTVVVSGENLTRSLSLTIDVPLKTTFVNSSMITATLPMTLKVGKYPVIVGGLVGKHVSSVFFSVDEAPQEEGGSAICAPWNPATPIPSAAPPGYDPHEACIVECCALAPQLVGPGDGAEARFGTTVELKWTWDYCLPSGWKFAIRISAAYPPHSYRYEDNPVLIHCQDGGTIGSFFVGKDGVGEEFIKNPGTYYWNIAVVRSLGNQKWERLSEESEIRSFTVQERVKDEKTDW